MTPRCILASDIDGTLTGNPSMLGTLAALVSRRMKTDLGFLLATGRSIEQVRYGFEHENIPIPHAAITDVGTTITLPPFTDTPLQAWYDHLGTSYDRQEALTLVDGFAGLRMQPEDCQSDLKLSTFVDGCPDPHAVAHEITMRCQDTKGAYRVIFSSDRDLDILPAASGKGLAVRFALKHLGWSRIPCIGAGDSGNDIALLEEMTAGIAVANADRQLQNWLGSDEASHVYRAASCYAGGVLEGLDALEPTLG